MTRMRVIEPRERSFKETSGCLGAKMADGTVYLADRHGVMNVENPSHARAMLRDPNLAGDIIKCDYHPPDNIKGKQCPKCAFNAYSFTEECPRCKTDLRKESTI